MFCFVLLSGSHIVPGISGKWKYYLITCLQTFKINLVIWILKRLPKFFLITNLRMTNLISEVRWIKWWKRNSSLKEFSGNLRLPISKYSWIIHGKGPRQESFKRLLTSCPRWRLPICSIPETFIWFTSEVSCMLDTLWCVYVTVYTSFVPSRHLGLGGQN